MKKKKFNRIMSIILMVACLLSFLGGVWGGVECFVLLKLAPEVKATADATSEVENAINLLSEHEEEYVQAIEMINDEATQSQISEGQKLIDSGWAQLYQGKALFAEARRVYDDGVAQLAVGKQQFKDATAQMEATRPEYEEGKRLLRQAELMAPFVNTYVAFKNGATAYLPGYSTLDEWFVATVIPFCASIGIDLPTDIEEFADNMNTAIAQGNEMIKQYEEAERQLANAKVLIDEAEAQLAEAKAVLDSQSAELGNAEREVWNADAQFKDAMKQLDEGIASLEEVDTAVKALEEGVLALAESKAVTDIFGKVSVKSVADRLGGNTDIYRHDENGEKLYLNGDVPALDYDKCLKVCTAYRAYSLDYAKDLTKEAVIRIVLNAAMIGLSVWGVICAVTCLRKKGSKRKKAIKRTQIFAAGLIAVTFYGLIVGYCSFAEPLDQPAFTGILPFFAYFFMTVVGGVFALSVYKARKRKTTEESENYAGSAL